MNALDLLGASALIAGLTLGVALFPLRIARLWRSTIGFGPRETALRRLRCALCPAAATCNAHASSADTRPAECPEIAAR